jgi:drug/metabolite transporter (DMT)-like permease
MLRGSVIIFSGILSVLFLKRKLNINNWAGMLVMTGGIVLVGYASLLSAAGSQGPWWQPMVGDLLVIGGCVA